MSVSFWDKIGGINLFEDFTQRRANLAELRYPMGDDLIGVGRIVQVAGESRGQMSIELSDISLPDQAEVKIEVSITSKINITAIVAQRKVSKLVLDQVSNLLYGTHPTLVAGERLLWRVPVWFGLPTTGPLGQVGVIDVDTQSGEILYSQLTLDDMAARAHELAQHTASASA